MILSHDTEVLVSAWPFAWQRHGIAKKPQVEEKAGDTYQHDAAALTAHFIASREERFLDEIRRGKALSESTVVEHGSVTLKVTQTTDLPVSLGADALRKAH